MRILASSKILSIVGARASSSRVLQPWEAAIMSVSRLLPDVIVFASGIWVITQLDVLDGASKQSLDAIPTLTSMQYKEWRAQRPRLIDYQTKLEKIMEAAQKAPRVHGRNP